ncbi:MAG TPA: VWA domain-containing protein [Candidatus Deferrimicrobium sp.]|nr:VWA domain-containing protein [Candidatus Deferrimicrobium sp.]
MNPLLQFAKLLRDVGFCVSLSEIMDAIRALKLFNNPEPGTLHYRIVQACLVKRIEDHAVFNTLYNIFFDSNLVFADLVDKTEVPVKISAGGGVQSGGLSTLAKAIVSGDFAPCSIDINSAVAGVCDKPGDIHEQVRQALISLDYFGALNTLRLANLSGLIEECEYQNAVNLNSNELVRFIEQQLIKHRIALDLDWEEATAHLNWRTKNFQLLNQAEMALVKKCVQKIGKRLAVRTGIKQKPSSCGELNFSRTISSAIATGGYCINLRYSRKFPDKPELVLLCDVSNSVYQFTGFMLQLIAAFRQRFEKVQAYVFVDTLWHIPNNLLLQELGQTLVDIRENNRCSVSGLSDFGKVFNEFHKEVLPNLSAKTVLLILGDGKNNWRPLELPVFKEITRKMNKVFWLNPLPQEHWGQEDCQIEKYKPYCTDVFECSNLAQLEKVALSIL